MATYSKATNPMAQAHWSLPGTWQHNTVLPPKPFAPLALLLIFLILWPSCWLPLVESTSVSKLQSETQPPLALQAENLISLVPEVTKLKVKSSRLSSPLRSLFSIRSASYNNPRDSVKGVPQTTIDKPTTTLAEIARLQAPTSVKSKDRPPASTKTPVPESSSETPTPEVRGDFALFGKPSAVGGFNLTAGILVNTTFTVLLLASAGLGTWHRAYSRRLLREEMDQAGFIEAGYSSHAGARKRGRDSSGGYDRRGARESRGKADDTDRYATSGRRSSREEIGASRTASTKQSFTDRRALPDSIRPRVAIANFDPNRSRSNGAGRTNDIYKERSSRQHRRAEAQAGPSVRFGSERKDFHNARAGNSQMPHGLKKSTLGGVSHSNGANRSDRLREDEYHKYTMDDRIRANFNRPGYSLPRLPKPALQQQMVQQYQPLPRPLLSVMTKTNPRQMPGSSTTATSPLSSTPTISRDLSRRAERKGSRSTAVDAPGSVDRSYSNAPPRSTTQDMNPTARGDRCAGVGGSSSGESGPHNPSLKNSYPTPIRRSSSKRLPPQMRG